MLLVLRMGSVCSSSKTASHVYAPSSGHGAPLLSMMSSATEKERAVGLSAVAYPQNKRTDQKHEQESFLRDLRTVADKFEQADVDGSHALIRDELAHLLCTDQDNPFVAAVFDSFTLDGSARVDYRELLLVACQLSVTSPEDILKFSYHVYRSSNQSQVFAENVAACLCKFEHIPIDEIRRKFATVLHRRPSALDVPLPPETFRQLALIYPSLLTGPTAAAKTLRRELAVHHVDIPQLFHRAASHTTSTDIPHPPSPPLLPPPPPENHPGPTLVSVTTPTDGPPPQASLPPRPPQSNPRSRTPVTVPHLTLPTNPSHQNPNHLPTDQTLFVQDLTPIHDEPRPVPDDEAYDTTYDPYAGDPDAEPLHVKMQRFFGGASAPSPHLAFAPPTLPTDPDQPHSLHHHPHPPHAMSPIVTPTSRSRTLRPDFDDGLHHRHDARDSSGSDGASERNRHDGPLSRRVRDHRDSEGSRPRSINAMTDEGPPGHLYVHDRHDVSDRPYAHDQYNMPQNNGRRGSSASPGPSRPRTSRGHGDTDLVLGSLNPARDEGRKAASCSPRPTHPRTSRVHADEGTVDWRGVPCPVRVGVGVRQHSSRVRSEEGSGDGACPVPHGQYERRDDDQRAVGSVKHWLSGAASRAATCLESSMSSREDIFEDPEQLALLDEEMRLAFEGVGQQKLPFSPLQNFRPLAGPTNPSVNRRWSNQTPSQNDRSVPKDGPPHRDVTPPRFSSHSWHPSRQAQPSQWQGREQGRSQAPNHQLSTSRGRRRNVTDRGAQRLHDPPPAVLPPATSFLPSLLGYSRSQAPVVVSADVQRMTLPEITPSYAYVP